MIKPYIMIMDEVRMNRDVNGKNIDGTFLDRNGFGWRVNCLVKVTSHLVGEGKKD